MNNLTNTGKSIFLGYLILIFYYLGVLAMLVAITYPPFKEVHENFTQHALVFERYIIGVLYIPGVLMLLAAVAMLFFRPAGIPKWTVTVSVLLSSVSVLAMLFNMIPFHHRWTVAGFDSVLFEQSKNITIAFQIVPSVLQAAIAAWCIYLYLGSVERITRIMFIALFSICFFAMGTLIVECHLNYALWDVVAEQEWPAYRKHLYMPVFAAVFLIPFYLPMIQLTVLAGKKRAGLSRGLVFTALVALVYVAVISFGYFVPHIQFPLDKSYSRQLLDELIRNEIRLRTAAEIVYWTSVAVMFWNFKSANDVPAV